MKAQTRRSALRLAWPFSTVQSRLPRHAHARDHFARLGSRHMCITTKKPPTLRPTVLFEFLGDQTIGLCVKRNDRRRRSVGRFCLGLDLTLYRFSLSLCNAFAAHSGKTIRRWHTDCGGFLSCHMCAIGLSPYFGRFTPKAWRFPSKGRYASFMAFR
jgi:hypothetical protein